MNVAEYVDPAPKIDHPNSDFSVFRGTRPVYFARFRRQVLLPGRRPSSCTTEHGSIGSSDDDVLGREHHGIYVKEYMKCADEYSEGDLSQHG